VGRPPGYQWQPLGYDTDPVPGDTAAIAEQVQYLRSVAKTMQGQVSQLKKIAANDSEVGQHADKIRSAASSLASSLQTLQTRYTNVSSQLDSWRDPLEQAQKTSLKALDEAEVPYAKLQQTVVLPSGSNLTAQQQQEITDYNNSMTQAQDALNAAKALLSQAISMRDTAASSIANTINNECNDSLRDHWSLSGWISEHVDLLKELASILQDIVAVLAVLCLLIPGVDVLILLAMLATAALLVIHTMLAATGNGSWLDVAIDVVGLLTLGVGLGAASEVEEGVDSATEAAYDARNELQSGVLDEFGDGIDYWRGVADAGGPDADFAQETVNNLYAKVLEQLPAMPEAVEESSGFWKTALSGKNFLEQAQTGIKAWSSPSSILNVFTSGGDPAIAGSMSKILDLTGDFSDSSKLAGIFTSADRTVSWANVAFAGGNSTVLGDFGLERIMHNDAYDHLKDKTTGVPSFQQVVNVAPFILVPALL
jgi:hypothetical protein